MVLSIRILYTLFSCLLVTVTVSFTAGVLCVSATPAVSSHTQLLSSLCVTISSPGGLILLTPTAVADEYASGLPSILTVALISTLAGLAYLSSPILTGCYLVCSTLVLVFLPALTCSFAVSPVSVSVLLLSPILCTLIFVSVTTLSRSTDTKMLSIAIFLKVAIVSTLVQMSTLAQLSLVASAPPLLMLVILVHSPVDVRSYSLQIGLVSLFLYLLAEGGGGSSSHSVISSYLIHYCLLSLLLVLLLSLASTVYSLSLSIILVMVVIGMPMTYYGLIKFMTSILLLSNTTVFNTSFPLFALLLGYRLLIRLLYSTADGLQMALTS